MKPVSELTDAELAAKGWRRVNWSVKEPPDPRLDVWVDERGVLRLYAHQWGPCNRADHCGEEDTLQERVDLAQNLIDELCGEEE